MHRSFSYILGTLLLLLGLVYLGPRLENGPRSLGTIETIHGIPFPRYQDELHITEKLAHVDVFLHQPVFARNLKLTITFRPGNIERLQVGVRENAFWLSYPTYDVYAGESAELATRTVIIPLTDKLADKDQSIDVMFFATTPGSTTAIDENVADRTHWYLKDLQAEVEWAIPTLAEAKDYIRSLIKREQVE